MGERMERMVELFRGDEPLETTIGLVITLIPVYLFTPALVAALVTETTFGFTLVTVGGWFLLAGLAYGLCRKAWVPGETAGFGRLIIWICSAVFFGPLAVALSYLCWRTGHGNVAPILLLLELGLLWGAGNSWREYEDG